MKDNFSDIISGTGTAGSVIQALNSTDWGVCLCDSSGLIEYIDETSLALIRPGKEPVLPSESRGLVLSELFTPSTGILPERFLVDKRASAVLQLEQEDGKERWVLARSYRIEYQDAPECDRLVLFSDLTELLGMLESFNDSERTLSSIINTIPDVLYRVDSGGVITYISDSVSRYGYSPAELTGRSIMDIVHPDDREGARCRMQERRTGIRRTRSYAVRLITGNYGVTPVEFEEQEQELTVSAQGLYLDHGELGKVFLGTQGIIRDMDPMSRRYMQSARVREFQAAGIMAGAFVHEFNNILTVILGNLSLAGMENTGKDSGITRLIMNTEHAASRLMELTRQLGEYTRPGQSDRKPVSIRGLLGDLTERHLAGSGCGISAVISDDLMNADADESQVRLVIESIVDNAMEALSFNGTIMVSAENVTVNEEKKAHGLVLGKGRYVMISVEDKGPGIRQQDREKIFRPRFTTRESGNGMGLALSYAIIKRHSGFMEFDSGEGRGTVFRVYLPAVG